MPRRQHSVSWRRQVRVLGGSALAPPHGVHLVVRGAGDLHAHPRERDPPPATRAPSSRRGWSPPRLRPRSTCSGCELTDDDLNIYSDLLDLIFNMSILNLDMFVLSFDMFLSIYYQSDLNFDQFDLNPGQIIYSYPGQLASTATTASSSPHAIFFVGFSSGGIRGGLPYALMLVSLFSRREWRRSPSSLGHPWYLEAAPASFLSASFFSA